MNPPSPPVIVLAGATGDLGGRIVAALLARGASVLAIVRRGSAPEKLASLRDQGAEVAEVDLNNVAELTAVCSGAICVVSALSGLRDVIVGMQTSLLAAAVAAGVPRFIPSDFCVDFTGLAPGTNRNLDLRRAFKDRLDAAPIAATSIFNGAFTDMLTGQAPFILFKVRRVLYWEDADQRMDFTTKDDTAAFTAAAALDPSTPRILRVAGDQISARELMTVATAVTGKQYHLLRAGGLGTLGTIIKLVRRLFPADGAVYPAWQGMQYMHNMFSGRATLDPLDNTRYPGLHWTRARDVLAAHERTIPPKVADSQERALDSQPSTRVQVTRPHRS